MTASGLASRLKAGLYLLVRYPVDAVRANFALARVLLTPRLDVAPTVLHISTRAETAFEVMVLANLVSFTPGTLTVKIVPGREIVVHTIDPALADEASILENLERPLLKLTRGDEP